MKVNQEAAARLWAKLIEQGQPKYYRSDTPKQIQKLFATGFSEDAQLKGDKVLSLEEPSGIFMTKREEDLGPLISGAGRKPDFNPKADMEIIPLKKARIQAFGDEEWSSKYEWKKATEISKDLKPYFDFVEVPDAIHANIDPETGNRYRQVVQINPKKALVKIRSGSWDWDKKTPDIYRILGATGAAVGAGAALPEDSDAALVQQFGKAAGKLVKQMGKAVPSSTEDLLKGRTLPAYGEDATIASVKDLGKGRRAVRLEDGRVFTAQIKDLEHMASLFGTEDRYNLFQEVAAEKKMEMAQASFKYHEARTQYSQALTPGDIKGSRKRHKEKVEDWIQNMSRYSDSPALDKQAYFRSVSGREYLILEDSAKILENLQLGKINKSATKYIRSLAHGTQEKWQK